MIDDSNAVVLGLIKQYLEYYQYNRALDALKVDVAQAGERFGPVPSDAADAVSSDLNQNELLALYDEGDVAEFFKVWRNNVPKESQLCDKECITMTFQLHLHFLVYPLRGNTQMGLFNERHSVFIKYLEEVATQHEVITNSSLARFLCLGLASIAINPLENRMIKEILQPSWSNALRDRLISFLTRVLKGSSGPYIFSLYDNSKKTKAADVEKRLANSEAKCVQYKGLYAQQQREYYNVLNVASELLESLESTVMGQQIGPETIGRIAAQLFQQPDPADPSQSLQFDLAIARPGTASNLLRQSVVNQEMNILQGPPSHASLDFSKIKKSLEEGNEERVCYLLQAVRWRLTKSETDTERMHTVDSFINEDLFGVQGPESYSKCVMSMLSSPNPLIQENLMRLVNVMSALGKGFTYLHQHQSLIQEMIQTLLNMSDDGLTRQAVLGALQKMSSNRGVQTKMLESDLMEWLLTSLSEPDELTEYSLHHSCALLMNLCLRTKGRRYISEDSSRLLGMIEGLLEHEQLLVREYMNGILFSALNMKRVRDKALEMGLEESLKLLITVSQPEMKSQLQYCLDQLLDPANEEDPESGDSDEEEDDVEDSLDALAMDLSLPESVIGDGLCGEALLCSEYLGDIKLKLPDSSQAQNQVQRLIISPREEDDSTPTPPKVARSPPPKVSRTPPPVPPPSFTRKAVPVSLRSTDMTPNSVPPVIEEEVDPNIPWEDRPIRPAKNQFTASNMYGP